MGEAGRQMTVETTANEKLLRGVQMLHGAVFSKRAPLVSRTCSRYRSPVPGISR